MFCKGKFIFNFIHTNIFEKLLACDIVKEHKDRNIIYRNIRFYNPDFAVLCTIYNFNKFSIECMYAYVYDKVS